MPASEGILGDACQFVMKGKDGITRALDRSETLISIFGDPCLMTLELVLGNVPYDWSREAHLWYEANEYHRESTMKRAIKTLRSTTSLNKHVRRFDRNMRRWLFAWEPQMIRDYPGWRPITECEQCHQWITTLVYCYNCPKIMCMRCGAMSGWPVKYHNVMCEECTEILLEAITE